MDENERLRFDYDQTTQLVRTLTDIRFKLLAFVPTVAGTTVGLLGRPRPAAELLAVGLLGVVATLGVFIYELRNSQLLDGALAHAQDLERRLGGGVLGERPPHSVRLLGLVPVTQNRGLGMVYGAALSAWSYLVAWGALRALDVGGARKAGAVIGAVVGLIVLGEVERMTRSSLGGPGRDSRPGPKA